MMLNQSLKRLNKTPNAIFARYQLTTRKQEVGESLEDFLLNLHQLSKNCQLQDVTKEQYRQELVRDAFVNNLSYPSIRMRLLEKDELSLEQCSSTGVHGAP